VLTGRLGRDEVPTVLASSDACLIHLRGCDLFRTVIPSKLFETMAMARPIIMGVKGEAREIVLQAQAGIPMEPDSPESLVQCVEYLADRPEEARQLGLAGQACVRDRFDREFLAGRMLAVVENAARTYETPATASPEPATAANGLWQRLPSVAQHAPAYGPEQVELDRSLEPVFAKDVAGSK
jgi:hypothetical protein